MMIMAEDKLPAEFTTKFEVLPYEEKLFLAHLFKWHRTHDKTCIVLQALKQYYKQKMTLQGVINAFLYEDGNIGFWQSCKNAEIMTFIKRSELATRSAKMNWELGMAYLMNERTMKDLTESTFQMIDPYVLNGGKKVRDSTPPKGLFNYPKRNKDLKK
jgi:hypothetical protein